MARAIAHWEYDEAIYTTNFDGASDLDVPLGMPVKVPWQRQAKRYVRHSGLRGSLGSSAGGSHDEGLSPIEGPMAAGFGPMMALRSAIGGCRLST